MIVWQAVEPGRVFELIQPLAGRLVALSMIQRYAARQCRGPRKRSLFHQ